MELSLDDELRTLLTCIQREEKTDAEWAAIESSDMFQSVHDNGGDDAIEAAFCLSFYDDRGEWWFQLTRQDVQKLPDHPTAKLSLRRAQQRRFPRNVLT